MDHGAQTVAATGSPAHATHGPLAHHFDSLPQQFDASKLGMWLFLCTEILLFAGLFCAYAVYRANHPDLFRYGHRYLDVGWGAINTVVLIFSSFTMATAVYAAQKGDTRRTALFLGLTLLGGVDFMGIKFVEYSHKFHEGLLWGKKFYEAAPAEPQPLMASPLAAAPAAPAARPVAGGRPAAAVLPKGDARRGRELFRRVCANCHGVQGEGVPGQGKDMRRSQFIASKSDAELLAFVKRGRMPNDPLNTTGKLMPPKGGNPFFSDKDLLDIIAYIREIQRKAGGAGGAQQSRAGSDPGPVPVRGGLPGRVGGGVVALVVQQDGSQAGSAGSQPLMMPQWVIMPPPEPAPQPVRDVTSGAEHMGPPAPPPDPHRDPNVPKNIHIFFGIYFLMTGLHGLHVLAGMVVIAWLLFRTVRGDFSASYYTPVDLGGLYWHLVDLIWIYLFPLLYLIH